ncbi:MAG: hypothetical protein FWD40_03385 [Treponema sp.]|nr:hypothetical protein [Treponema sp.]
MDVIMHVTEPLPFDPAMWMEGAHRSGRPASSASVSILSRRKLLGFCPRSRLICPESHWNTSPEDEK